MKLPAKPTAAALACAREIEESEPFHKRSEQRIVEKATIIDRYMVPREVPLHDLREAFTNLRTTLYGLALDARQAEVAQRAINKINDILRVNTTDEKKPPLSESEQEAFVKVETNPASD